MKRVWGAWERVRAGVGQRPWPRPPIWLAVATVVVLLAVSVTVTFSPTAVAPPPARTGPLQVLLIADEARPSTLYYAEILRAEGFTGFRTVNAASLTRDLLDGAAVAVVAPIELSPERAELLSRWAGAGGNVIAAAPDPDLNALVGLDATTGSLSDGYIRVDTASAPGQGITGETIQFHGTAALYRPQAGTVTVAEVFSDADTATGHPAVTLRPVGANGGHAAAFAYDLATSVIRTRQGNPDWAGQERDGVAPIRANDLYAGDGRNDYVDLSRAAIPQADEQQRLLANLVIQMTTEQSIQVRSWYFPKGAKAVLVLAADDHNPGDKARATLAYQDAESAPGCSVANWECIRSTSLMYTTGDLTDAELARYRADGFDFGVHVTTDCRDWTEASLAAAYASQLEEFSRIYPSQPAQRVNRIHCVAWSDYAGAARIGRASGLRLDLDYYYWPARWVQNRPGFFTGSGIPMRFTNADGTLIDVYQAPSHLVNESGMTFPGAIIRQLDRALGPLGYYGAFGTHYDYTDDFDRQLVDVGKRLGVPMVSADQLLTWLDARAATTFSPGTWDGPSTRFTADVDPAAGELLRGMIPYRTGRGTLTSLSKDGVNQDFSSEMVKGTEYAFFTATSGSYTATYTPDVTAPTLSMTSPMNGGSLRSGSDVVATFSEPLDPVTVGSGGVRLLDPAGGSVPITVTRGQGNVTLTITPKRPLAAATAYRLEFGSTITDVAGNALERAEVLFTTGDGTMSLWAPDEPFGVSVAEDDLAAVELGVRFTATAAGRVSGIWFFKGDDGVDRHRATLWTADGKRLATASTEAETPGGWQRANFAEPVAVEAGKAYVASYLAPKGRYRYISDDLVEPFSNGALTVAATGGGYRYGGGFPGTERVPTNYLVDVAFTPLP